MPRPTDVEKDDGVEAGFSPAGKPVPGESQAANTEASLLARVGLKRPVIGAAIVLAVASGIAWWYLTTHESTDDAQIDGHIVPVSARAGGTVASVLVEDNQAVEAGALLVEIDARDYLTALDKSRADLADAEAAAMAARAGVPITSTTTRSEVTTTQAGISSAEAGSRATQKEVEARRARVRASMAKLEEARANQRKASRDLERMKQLVQKDEISQQQYDAAEQASAAANAAVASAEATVAEDEQQEAASEVRLVQSEAGLAQAKAEASAAETAPQKVAATRARLASAEARVAEAKAALAQAELNLEYTRVKAPVAGVVSKKTVQVGQNVAAGQPLLAVVPLEDVWVTANFKETQMKRMRVGQPAVISVDALGGRQFRGHVDSIAAATGEKFSLLPPENAAGNYVKVVQRLPVKIVFEKGQDTEHLLRPGMSVEPTVITK